MTPAGSVRRLSVKPQTKGERGLPKRAVSELRITSAGAEGDYNHYRTTKVQGDPDLAILVLTEEVIETLRREGWPVEPGDLGENLTLSGVPEASLKPGARLTIGEVVLYVGKAKGPEFVRTLVGRRGWFTRVLSPGKIATGDGVTVESPSAPSLRSG